MTRAAMKAMWVLLVVCVVGCVESNPQPSPMAGADSSVSEDVGASVDGTGGDVQSPDAGDVFDMMGVPDACIPVCEDEDGPLECGDDGCGGSCGECDSWEVCAWGRCEVSGCYNPHAPPCETGADCVDGLCVPFGDELVCTCACIEECPFGLECRLVDEQEMVFGCLPPCVPDCLGRECGPDGCGGSCGECMNWCDPFCDLPEVPYPDPMLCGEDGTFCYEVCCPDCCGKECGDDGCGGICGQCTGAQATCAQGSCVCVPDCDGKVCGDDGCGGECGTCSDEEQCVNSLCGPPWGGTWLEIPGGLYVMGCTAGDDSCDDDELPPHQVMVSSFEMLQTEVTEGQYENVTGEAASCGVGWPGGPDTPVTCVTWLEAVAFCEAVGGRLPTEAEWEYAARAGTTTQYYCGDDPACLHEIAWYIDNSSGFKHDVMWKDPNDFGLFDMLGNVLEWTEDWYHESYDGAPQIGFPAWESLLGTQRVARGGDFAGGKGGCKVYRRTQGDPTDDSLWNVGFRCARTPGD